MTLQDIYDQEPCKGRWGHSLTALGHGDFSGIKDYRETEGHFPPDQKISLGDVAILNGAADAFWCVRAMPWDDIDVRRKFLGKVLLPMCYRVAMHATDSRMHDIVDAISRWCNGDVTVDLAAAAREVAWAAWAEAGAAWAERAYQRRDIIAAYPPLVAKEESDG